MQKKLRLLLLIVVLALVLGGGLAGYRKLGSGVTAQVPQSSASPAESFTDFTVYDENGSAVALSSLLGKPLLVNYWATWCPYCVQEMPDLQQAYETYGDRVNFVMVNLTDGVSETMETASAFAAENAYTFPICFDLDNDATTAYAVHSYPTTLFLAADGAVLHRQVGAMTPEMIEQFMQMLLTQ